MDIIKKTIELLTLEPFAKLIQLEVGKISAMPIAHCLIKPDE
jgi:hypothetical protein